MLLERQASQILSHSEDDPGPVLRKLNRAPATAMAVLICELLDDCLLVQRSAADSAISDEGLLVGRW